MSGIEMLARLRENHCWKNLPVVVLSGFGKYLNSDVMTRLGVHIVLTKTEVSAAEVVRRIDQTKL
jgi:hypothetical protein